MEAPECVCRSEPSAERGRLKPGPILAPDAVANSPRKDIPKRNTVAPLGQCELFEVDKSHHDEEKFKRQYRRCLLHCNEMDSSATKKSWTRFVLISRNLCQNGYTCWKCVSTFTLKRESKRELERRLGVILNNSHPPADPYCEFALRLKRNLFQVE